PLQSGHIRMISSFTWPERSCCSTEPAMKHITSTWPAATAAALKRATHGHAPHGKKKDGHPHPYYLRNYIPPLSVTCRLGTNRLTTAGRSGWSGGAFGHRSDSFYCGLHGRSYEYLATGRKCQFHSRYAEFPYEAAATLH